MLLQNVIAGKEKKNKKQKVEEITYNSFGCKQVNEKLVGGLSYIDKQTCRIIRSQSFVSFAVGRITQFCDKHDGLFCHMLGDSPNSWKCSWSASREPL